MDESSMTAGERFSARGGWVVLVLVLGMIISASWTLMMTEWTDGLHILVMVAIVGAIAGTFLAISRIPGFVAHIFALIYGTFFVPFLIGASGLYPSTVKWFDRINDMSWRIHDWAVTAMGGGTSRDRLMFVILSGALFWLLGYTATWYTFRYPRIWRAILPLGVVTLLVVYYYPEYGPRDLTIYLLAYLLFALLYIVRVSLAQREDEWRRKAVTFSPEIQFDMLRAGLLFAVVMLVFSWGAPTAAASAALSSFWTEQSGPVRQMQQDWQRLFSSLRTYGSAASDAYGNRLTLGGPIKLSDEPVFDVYAPKFAQGRLYWRAVAFDTYDGMGWRNTDTGELNIDPGNQTIVQAPEGGRIVITETVTPFVPASTLVYGAQSLLAVSVPSQATLSYSPDGLAWLSMMHTRSAVRPGESYQVLSLISQADPASLAAAPADYPQWVRDRYLQLPASVTLRTKQLAQQITQGASTPYDKAAAIETWLRSNIKYSQDVAAPPDGQDGVDYFLFNTKQGYCNYYASAMVVMLRSVGVPARFAAGYAQGDYNADRGAYRVRARDAHAWPEVYFPGYGWIEFEPTSSQDAIVRPDPPKNQPAQDPAQGNEGEDTQHGRPKSNLPADEFTDPAGQANSQGPLVAQMALVWAVLLARGPYVLGALLIVVLLARFAWWSAEERGFRGLSPASATYGRLLRYAEWLGVRTVPAQTPHERARAVGERLPNSLSPVMQITDLYVSERFGRGQPATEPVTLWKSLRPSLLRGMLRSYFAGLAQLPRRLSWRARRVAEHNRTWRR